tara:strand:- start:1536 stop:3317 length:1782 start_codon:yes stop_codon:yes gene_type:complete
MPNTKPLSSYYEEQITRYGEKLVLVKQQLTTSSLERLAVFFLGCFGIFLAFGNVKWVLAILILAIALFLYLVSRHSDLQYKRDKLLALIHINEVELEALARNFHSLPEGNEFKDPMHFFSQDIDLFGRGSFFQFINRTALQQGRETLAGLLVENATDNIPEKQEAIMELGKMSEWRQEFSAIATLVRTDTPYQTIIQWMQGHKPFVPAIMKSLPLIFTAVSVGLIGLYFLGLNVGLILLMVFLLGLGISGKYLKKINKLSSDTSKILSTFRQYQKLIVDLEATEFEAVLLQKRRAVIIREGEKTSVSLKKFADLLNALDQRNNMLIGLFANGFMLRDLKVGLAIEQWIDANRSNVAHWFGTIAFFDAYNSLGNYAFNHPHYVFPKLTNDNVVLKSKGAGHPLLDPEKCVLNDFKIDSEQFFIITGANMAGKSTFLRTVSLQIVMANVGLPVCATAVEYTPIKLITSMRTTDSLTDDESYFFSELKRLRFIVDKIQTDRYFIVLDEILKGTNSTDKAKGSRKFVEKLVRSRSTGIIATHDLSLCEAAIDLPQIKNYYFDAEIIDNELHFDYRFKSGICQNMNASFLLKKMGIVD